MEGLLGQGLTSIGGLTGRSQTGIGDPLDNGQTLK